jgi:hypothetical protein
MASALAVSEGLSRFLWPHGLHSSIDIYIRENLSRDQSCCAQRAIGGSMAHNSEGKLRGAAKEKEGAAEGKEGRRQAGPMVK